MAQLDLNKDGELNTGEVVVGMAHILGQDLSVSEEVILGMNEDALIALARLLNTVQVSEHDFVRTWHDTFGDCEDFSTALFRSFDANRDSILTIQEVEGILFHVRQVSGNLDGHITTQEFHDFFISEEDVVQILMTEMDHDKDGEVTTAEVVIGLANVLQKNLNVPDEVILGMNEAGLLALAQLENSFHVTEDEYVRLWHEKFGDCEDFVAAVFRSFDDNRDGIVNVRELEGIMFHVRQVAGNLDGHITTQEFHDFFTWVLIRTTDTDVLVLAIAHFHKMAATELWIAFGCGKNFRDSILTIQEVEGILFHVRQVSGSGSIPSRSEEDVVQILMTEMDHDKDGEVTTAEVVIGLANVLEQTLSVPDEIILGMNEAALIALAKLDDSIHVTEHEFVRLWHEKFGDCVDFVAAVFRSFDDNRDGIINVQELEGILFHVRQVAGNLDGHITTQEFHDFFTWGQHLDHPGGGRSEEDAVQILMTEMDHDKDGEVTTAEVVIGLADVLQKNLSVPDEIILGMNEASLIALAKLDNSIHVTEDEFVRLWHEKFGDCVDFVAAVFRSFDDNRDGIINVQELEGILFHVRQVAGNLDGHITTQEFHDFFTWLYKVEGC
nr:hypothetical protein BaRGS_020512 [Batillaria attramentaria]